MKKAAAQGRNTGASTFVSNLGSGAERFLAHVIDHGLSSGHRQPDDFLRHFDASTIMVALEGEPDLRARILVETTGIKHKIALRKDARAAAEDLQFAFDENETDAASVLDLLGVDERVRFLDPGALWAYVSEGDFWEAEDADDATKATVSEHMVLILSRALEEELVDQRALIEPLGVERLVRSLPGKLVTKVLERALEEGTQGSPFNYETLLKVVPIPKLVEHISLATLWNDVIVPKIARECGFLGGTGPARRPAAGATNGKGKKAAAAEASTKTPPPHVDSGPSVATKGGKNRSKKPGNGKTPKRDRPAAGAEAATPPPLDASQSSAGGTLELNDDVFNALDADEDLVIEEVAADTDMDVVDDALDELSDDLTSRV